MYEVYVAQGYRPTSATYSMYSSDSDRTLILAKNPDEGFDKLSDRKTLTESELQWFISAANEINRAHLKNCEADYVEYLNKFADILERELDKAAREGEAK